MPTYDALIVVSFGGPEGPDDVMPFLENVTRGRNVPRERLEQVAEHYSDFGGVSPINQQNRALIAALENELAAHGPQLPIYFGNRNWHPLLPDTVRRMADDGVRHALAFVTSAFSSYSGCRQYLDDIERARASVGERAPHIDKLRGFGNHPGFIEPMVEHVRASLERVPLPTSPTDGDARGGGAPGHHPPMNTSVNEGTQGGRISAPADRAPCRIVFTAHSVPLSMADHCEYVEQLRDASTLVAERVPGAPPWDLVYQSRSGPPHQPWLEPDILDHLDHLHTTGVRDVIVVPIGFISDHMEVIYDLDTEAKRHADELGMNLIRVPTVGTHPRFVHMIRELIRERMDPGVERRALGSLGPAPDACSPDCCPPPRR